MFVSHDFIQRGFSFIPADAYLQNQEEYDSLTYLNQLYTTNLQADGPRNRAYLKLQWDRASDLVSLAKNQSYFQTAERNEMDGGKPRNFAVMDPHILELPVLQRLLENNLQIVREYEPLKVHDQLTLGLHFIQYVSEQGRASYSSPVGLHIDDEPLVFVHLLELSSHAWGGDNLIAKYEDQEITNVIRLESPMETILLNNNCYHAVTPLGSRKGLAIRNIILFTIEPHYTQVS